MIATVTAERDDDVPLRFAGRLLGEGTVEGTHGSTIVRLYLTDKGNFVAQVIQSRPGDEPSHRAMAARELGAIFRWLRSDAGGRMGRASLAACRAACEALGVPCEEEV